MGANKLDIELCKSAIAGRSYGDCREKWFIQAIEELELARQRIAELESALGHFGPNEWD